MTTEQPTPPAEETLQLPSGPVAPPPKLRREPTPQEVREYGGNVISTLRNVTGLRIEEVNRVQRVIRGNIYQSYNKRLKRIARYEMELERLEFGSEEYNNTEDRLDKLVLLVIRMAESGDKFSEKVTASAMAAGLDVGLPSTAPRVDAEVSDAE